jgi:hypothetical protein
MEKKEKSMNPDDMTLEERITFEENGLRNLEQALLTKQDWASPEVRETALQEFYALALRLRSIHQQMLKGQK